MEAEITLNEHLVLAAVAVLVLLFMLALGVGKRASKDATCDPYRPSYWIDEQDALDAYLNALAHPTIRSRIRFSSERMKVMASRGALESYVIMLRANPMLRKIYHRETSESKDISQRDPLGRIVRASF